MFHFINRTALFLFALFLLCCTDSGSYARTDSPHRATLKFHRSGPRRRIHRLVRQKRIRVKHSLRNPNTVKHYPPPGSAGEERNTDWLRKRAYPNEYIDADYYPNALAQARALPIYHGYGKEATQSAMQWQSIGPFTIGGRVTAIATHPTDSNIFYVGAASGGLWKTIDHGTTWASLTDTFASLPIGCVTLDPHDPETIYIGMGECNNSGDSYPGNGLWRSINGGLSWNFLGLGKTQYIAKVIVDPVDKNVIWVCVPGPNSTADSNRGIWKSIDDGATWTRSLLVRTGKTKTSSTVPAIDLVMNPSDSKDLVAALWQHIDFNVTASPNTGLWRTRDSGSTWNRIDTVPGSGYPNGFVLRRLVRTSLLWVLNSKGVPTLYSVVSKVDKNPVTGYTLDDNFYGVFSTTNPSAGPWKNLLDSNYRIPFLGNNIDSVDLFNKQGGYDNFIVANSHHPDEIYIGGIDIIRSINGGTTWTDISKAYPHYFANDRSQHSDMHALAFSAAKGGDDLLNGQDGGVFNTRNFGASWTQLRGLPITMFYHLEPWEAGMSMLGNNFPADSIKLLGGTQDNGTVAHGFSANTDWDWINRGDGGQAQTDPKNASHLITSLQLGKLFFRTTLDSLRPNLFSDNGNHDPNAKKWIDLSTIARRRGITDSSEACGFIPPVVLDKIKGDEVYTGRTHVYKTKLSFSDPDSGTVIQSWSPQIAGNPGNPKTWYYGDIECLALGARDQNGRAMIWAGGIIGGTTSMYRTAYDPILPADSAPRWMKVISGLPVGYAETIATDRSDSLTAFCGLTGTSSTKHLYKTINGGKNWISISGNLPNVGVNVVIIDSLAEQGNPLAKNQCIIVATDVGVFVTTDGGITWFQLGTGMPHLVVGTIAMYKNWLVAGTHGRSAWALDVSALRAMPVNAVHEKNITGSLTSIKSIYPSPLGLNAKSTLHLSTSGFQDQRLLLQILNASTGATAFQTQADVGAGELQLELPSSLSSGSYLIRITSNNGMTATSQVLIVK